MQIGFALNEFLALATALSGLLAIAWRARQRRGAPGKPWWVGWGAEFFTVLALVFGCRVAVADWQRVPSSSMEPTLRIGDLLLINHLAYGPRLPFTNTALPIDRPQRGDVAVFRYPHQVSQFYVKRLVALAGDVVEFRDGLVAVNGEPFAARDAGASEHPSDLGQRLLHETSAGREHTIKLDPQVRGRLPMTISSPDCIEPRAGHWRCTVPAGHVLALGDNRDRSADSRSWGFLPEREIYGRVDRVLFNYLAWNRWFERVS